MSSSERLVFSVNIEALWLGALDGQMTPALMTELAELGLDLRKRLPGYPVEVWYRGLEATVRHLDPDVPRDEALERLGQRFIGGMAETMIGRAVAGAAKLFGPKRALDRIIQNMKRGANYIEGEVTPLGEGRYALRLNERSCAGFTRGCVHAVLAMSGAKGIEISSTQDTPDRQLHTIRWAGSAG